MAEPSPDAERDALYACVGRLLRWWEPRTKTPFTWHSRTGEVEPMSAAEADVVREARARNPNTKECVEDALETAERLLMYAPHHNSTLRLVPTGDLLRIVQELNAALSGPLTQPQPNQEQP